MLRKSSLRRRCAVGVSKPEYVSWLMPRPPRSSSRGPSRDGWRARLPPGCVPRRSCRSPGAHFSPGYDSRLPSSGSRWSGIRARPRSSWGSRRPSSGCTPSTFESGRARERALGARGGGSRAPPVRRSPVLFSAITDQALFPAVTPDDVLAAALPLWLVLLPVGRRMVVAGRRDWKSWLLDGVNGWPWLCCVLFFFAVLGRLCLTTGDSAASLGRLSQPRGPWHLRGRGAAWPPCLRRGARGNSRASRVPRSRASCPSRSARSFFCEPSSRSRESALQGACPASFSNGHRVLPHDSVRSSCGCPCVPSSGARACRGSRPVNMRTRAGLGHADGQRSAERGVCLRGGTSGPAGRD